MNSDGMMQIGVISDTHGLLRPEVPKLFVDADLILHAGDIGSPEVLSALEAIAQVVAVRGNNDKGTWARSIPDTKTVRIRAGLSIYIIHDLKELDSRPPARPVQVIVSGHSHRPLVEQRDGILFLNPGSAGPRRFRLPISVGRLKVDSMGASAEIVEIAG